MNRSKNKKSHSGGISRERKTILIILLVVLTIIGIRLFFLAQQPVKTDDIQTIEPDYNKLMQTAIQDLEAADSALIYKDTEKAEKLLKSARKNLETVIRSPELAEEATKMLQEIEAKEKTLANLKEKIKASEAQ